jgi:hypothetical protein
MRPACPPILQRPAPGRVFRPGEPWPPVPAPEEETEAQRRDADRRRRLGRAGILCCRATFDRHAALLELLLSRVPWLSPLDPGVVLVSVGDGSFPLTGAVFATLTAWTCHSVDPGLMDRRWPVDHLVVHREPVERVRLTADRAVVVSLNAHVALATSLSAVVAGHVAVLAVPCPCPRGSAATLARKPDARGVSGGDGGREALVWIDAADLAGHGCIDRLLPELPDVPREVHLLTPEQGVEVPPPRRRRAPARPRALADASDEMLRLMDLHGITRYDPETGLMLSGAGAGDLHRWRRRNVVQRTVRGFFRDLAREATLEASRLARWIGLPERTVDRIARAGRTADDRQQRMVRLVA